MNLLDIVFLSVGLAIDASCVCTTSGLIYKPKLVSTLKIALPFGIALLSISLFAYDHIVAFVLLCAIGIKMLADAWKTNDIESIKATEYSTSITLPMLFIQAFSTSDDVLSVGVTLHRQSIPFMLLQ